MPRAPAKPVDNSAAKAAAKRIEDLQGQVAELERKLKEEGDRRVALGGELQIAIQEQRSLESKYLEEAVRRGTADGARAGLESALANANHVNQKLAAMKPPATKPAPPTPPPQWKMEVHRDGLGNIREIMTPTIWQLQTTAGVGQRIIVRTVGYPSGGFQASIMW